MKSILMSIKPKWVEKIARGEKTVEVRKSVPKCGTPFKVYIYCTFPRKPFYTLWLHRGTDKRFLADGKVVGEFVCDKIECVKCLSDIPWSDPNGERELRICKDSCITFDEIAKYGEGSNLWAWHISDLKIYDKPKELSEFNKVCKMPKEVQCEDCPYCDWNSIRNTCFARKLTRPPQSWCYVEEL